MSKSPPYIQQSKSEVEEICIYQNIEIGRHSIYSWKQIPLPGEKESQATISERSRIQSFIQQKVHLCLQ